MNVILIISDTFRYDNLFDRAAMPVRTPNLDAFAARAVSAERMMVSSFPTIPHRTDLASGRYGWPWHGWQDLRLSTRNALPALLKQGGGHVTQLLGDAFHLMKSRFDRVFDAAYMRRGQEGDAYFLRMNRPLRHVMPPEKTRSSKTFLGYNLPDTHTWINQTWRYEEDRFAPQSARLAVQWLEENDRHEPFFLWLDFFDPHEPWDPPEYMVRKYDPDYAGTPMIHPNYGKASDLTPEELRNLRAHYCAEAELVDRAVGRVLQRLDDLDLWRNSIVIFTSDHGMSLGEHNRTGKSNINDRDERYWPIYGEIAHVPFMVAAPGIEGGRTIDALLQPVDILPTVLELAGVEVTPPEPFHGASFAPLVRGEDLPPLREFAISGACSVDNGRFRPCGTTPVVYSEEWAYAPVGQEGERELYSLKDDPLTQTDVAAGHPDVVDGLHAKMLAWLGHMNAPAEWIAALER